MKKYAVILALFLGGCGGFFTVPSKHALKQPRPPIQEHSKTTLFDGPADFSHKTLSEGGIALLGILSPGEPEGLIQNAAFELFQGLRTTFPKMRIIPRKDVIQKISEVGKSQDFEAFLKSYQASRVMDVARLREWGEIEGVRFLFIAQVTSIDKHTRTKTMVLGEKSVAGKVSVFSSGPIHIPYDVRKEISLSGELWDSRCGKAVWMGSTHAKVREAGEIERVRMEDIFISVSRNLVKTLNRAITSNNHKNTADC
ncbi:MAG: hypothetical protein ACE5FY_03315 [Nitrospiria bacterium]